MVKVGIHLHNLADNSSCRKYVTNCSNVYPVIQLLKMFFENILEWLLLKGSCKDIYILKVQMVKIGIHLHNSVYNSNCMKYVTNCSNVYPVIQLLKMSC